MKQQAQNSKGIYLKYGRGAGIEKLSNPAPDATLLGYGNIAHVVITPGS